MFICTIIMQHNLKIFYFHKYENQYTYSARTSFERTINQLNAYMYTVFVTETKIGRLKRHAY